MHVPPAMHVPHCHEVPLAMCAPLPGMPPCHAHLPATPAPHHTCPLPHHAHLPATHAPHHTSPPPTMHTSPPSMPPCHAPPAIHAFPHEQNHRCLWKHNLAATTLWTVKRGKILPYAFLVQRPEKVPWWQNWNTTSEEFRFLSMNTPVLDFENDHSTVSLFNSSRGLERKLNYNRDMYSWEKS